MASRKQIFGGYTYTNPKDVASGAKADSMQSIGNTVDLNHMTFGAKTDSDTESGLILANGVVSESDKGTSAHVNGANGSLTLSNSIFYVTQVAGGYANVKAGSATVENNTVEIVNSDFLAGADGTSNAVRSGVVESTIKSGSSANLAVINNTLSYTHSGGSNNQIVGSVEAAKATLNYDSATKPQSGDIWNSSIQLKGNSATIGENIIVSDGNVVGAVATVVTSKPPIKFVPDVSLEQNNVTFNGSITGDHGQSSGQVTAAWSDTGGTLNNNTVTINGSVTDGLIIAARAGSGRAYGNDTAGGPQYNELSNNSVKIESDAKIIGTDIYAALSTDYNSVALGNTVTVQGQVSNGSIYGGAGADSLIDLASNSTLKLNVETAGKPVPYNLSSDNVNLAGRVEVGNEATLNVTGYFKDGNDQTSSSGPITYNTNSTTIASSATILNAGTIKLYGATEVADGASLHALSAGAQIEVNGATLGLEPDSIVDGDFSNNALHMISSLSKVGDFGSLKLSLNTLNSYLQAGQTYTDSTNSSRADLAGSINLASGGAIEFTDAVVDLSDLDYSNSKVQGKIQVEIDLTNGGSIFRGDTINVSHKLATNGSSAEKYDDLTNAGLKVGGVVIEANTLNLGTNSLTSSQSADIQFGKATAKEVINFNAATSGKDANNGNVPNDGYHLTSEVVGSNYMLTRDQMSNNEYYTGLNGTVNGTVTITENTADSGVLTIQDGYWTAGDRITVASGGTLTVGDVSAADPKSTQSIVLPDATLDAAGGLVLDVGTGNADVNVTGDTRYPTTERDVILDLRNGGLSMVGNDANPSVIGGKATITVKNTGAVVRVDADDINAMLGQNHTTDDASGAFFKATNHGKFEVEGDIAANFTDFNSNDSYNGFNLSGDGVLSADSLSVTNENDTSLPDRTDSNYIAKSTAIDFAGKVEVADLQINDLQQTTDADGKAQGYASQVKVKSGTLQVSQNISSVNDTLVLGQTDSEANLQLLSATSDAAGTIAIDNLRVDNGTVSVFNGEWTGTNVDLHSAEASLVVGGYQDEEIDTAANLTLDKLTMADGSELTVNADGTALLRTADFSALTAPKSVVVHGYLTINDAVSTTANNKTEYKLFGADGSISIDNNGYLTFGADAVQNAIIASGSYSTAQQVQDAMVEGFGKIENQGGMLTLSFASGSVFGADAIQALKRELFTSNSFSEDDLLAYGGILNIGDATFEGLNITEENSGDGLSGWKATWDSVKDFSDIFGNIDDVTTNKKNQTNVYNIGLTDEVKGVWGSLSMVANVHKDAQVTLAGDTSLVFAAGNNNKFISDATHQNALGAIVASQKNLNLIGGGEIGKITLQEGANDAERNYTTLNISAGENAGAVTTIAAIDGALTQGTIAANTLVNVASDTVVTGDITNIEQVDVVDGASLTATNAEVESLTVNESSASISDTLTIANGGEGLALGGSLQAKTIKLEDGSALTSIHEGLISAETVTVVDTGSTIEIGVDIDNIDDTISPDHDNSYYTGTGYFEVSDYLDLNGGTLIVDPAYTEATSVAAVMNFKDGNDKTYETQFNDVGIVDGDVWVGKNAALGIGATLAETKAAIATYQKNGALDATNYGSILYLNGQLTLANNSEIALNSDANVTTQEGIRESLKYTITEQALDQYADLGLGNNTAILMTENAFTNDKGEKTGTAIVFDRSNAVVNSLGGDIVLAGTFDASEKLNIFDDADKDGVKVVGTTGIEVRTQNGFLYYVIELGDNKGKDIQLEVDKEHAYSIMSEASTPVVNSLIAYHEGRIDNTGNSGNNSGDQNTDDSVDMTPIVPNDDATQQTAQTKTTATEDLTTIEPPVENTANTAVRGASVFLNDVVNNSHGAPAEAVARMALYGGAVQAAIAANTSSYEAIAARTGVGATDMGLTIANNGMGAALWLAPMYKNQDSDSFDAEGLSYGVDMDLYGVALGADFEFMPGLTAGIMFNVGSGSADGQGNAAASSVSNDFDYYGISVYGNYKYDALSITADLGYTAVDSDIDAHTGLESYGSVSTSVDSTAWTLGVTGKYTFNVGGVELAPHAGLRYSSIDLDDYSVSDIASYDADTMDIFSIPVGVTIAKEFSGEAWTVKPSLDLSVQGNFGDDTSDGTVHWTGVDGLATNVSSEMMDNFTYGATLGVSAQTGSFSMGLGVNYTGSDNVDEFGVNANARFVF